MLFHKSLLATLVCLVPFGLAYQVKFTEWPDTLTPGKAATFRYTGDLDTPTTIALRKGESGNLHDVKILTAEARGGSWTFTPDDSIPGGDDYAYEIKQNGEVNYSGKVRIDNGPAEIPPSKGPPPSNDGLFHLDGAPLDTAPHVESEMTVGQGNTGPSATVKQVSKPTGTGPAAIQKSIVASKTTANAASFNEFSLFWALGGAAAALYFGQ